MAKAKGVELSKVTDAMLAAYTKHEQDEVTAGQETQAEADTEIAAFKDRLDDIVNGKPRLALTAAASRRRPPPRRAEVVTGAAALPPPSGTGVPLCDLRVMTA